MGLFSTGDELCDPGSEAPPGCIYDSNRHTLAALLDGLGCAVTDLGILPDRLEPIRETLEEAAAGNDLTWNDFVHYHFRKVLVARARHSQRVRKVNFPA